MLIRFQVSNYRSIKDPAELSMVAIDEDRQEVRPQPQLKLGLLPVAAIYGPNASGKTNVLSALAWLQMAVESSLRGWVDEIPVDPFAFSDAIAGATTFELEMTVAGVRYEYLLEVDSEAVRYEALFHYPMRLRKRVFEREGDKQPVMQRGLGSLAGAKQLLTPHTLFLSAARRAGESLVDGFMSQLVGMTTRGLSLQRRRGVYIQFLVNGDTATRRLFEKTEEPSLFDGAETRLSARASTRDQALALLRMADPGIDDVSVEQEEIPLDDGKTWRRPLVTLLHEAGRTREPLPFSEESAGTREWFDLIGPAMHALSQGSIFLVDELDASLHPVLSAQLIRLFGDQTTNSTGAQLIFTSHDTSLLSGLYRDEVWFTQKNPDGGTRLGPLSEFASTRVRASTDLQAGYLAGRFGALPDIDKAGFLRALGLIG